MKRASDRVRGLLPSREEARGISVSAFSYCDRTQVKRQGNENGFKHPCARKGFAATPKAGNGGYPFKERENGIGRKHGRRIPPLRAARRVRRDRGGGFKNVPHDSAQFGKRGQGAALPHSAKRQSRFACVPIFRDMRPDASTRCRFLPELREKRA